LSATALETILNPGRRWVVRIICLYAVATLAVLPFAGVKAPELPAITPFLVAGVLTTELSISFLLFAWFTEVPSWSSLLLACSYLYSGLMAIAHLLTFPGAAMPGWIMLGGPQTASWTFLLWTDGYAALTFAATILESFPSHGRIAHRNAGIATAIGCGAVLAFALAGLVVAAAGPGRITAAIHEWWFTVTDRL
jgi:hypothetical protein